MKLNPVQGLAAGAAAVTVALTGTAFWLSYEHLHDVAAANGLSGLRAWAWPGTVDLFIVAGELLILRAALRGRFDWFAYLLAGAGSLASIALNVAGVGWGAEPLEYVVAAVPPVAALLAFGALMRQVHEALAKAGRTLAIPDPPVMPPVTAGPETQPEAVDEVTTEVTIERADTEPEQVVIPPIATLEFRPLTWPPLEAGPQYGTTAAMTSVVPADEPRQMVSMPVTITPAELRRQARKLNREAVSATGRPVTIDKLRSELGLSRREATDIRREIVGGSRS
ncbi:DUF2637 domain-containing protein [Streptomyces sp. SYSU K21746]